MSRRLCLVLGLAPCVAAIATTAFAQAPAATTTTPDTTTAPPAAAATDTGAATTTTTTQTTTAPVVDTATPPPALPRTGGDPASFVLVGTTLAGSMLALRRRFSR